MGLLAGAVGAEFVVGSARGWFATLAQPAGTPPIAVFASISALLYAAIGIAGWLVWRRIGASPALRLWGWQLALNALCAPAFFALHSPLASLIIVAALCLVLGRTIRSFARIDSLAACLMLPYAAWVGYATYLAAGFWWLN